MSLPRWVLTLQAKLIRCLGFIAPLVWRLLGQKSTPATFTRIMYTTISPRHSTIAMHFYTPANYYQTRSRNARPTIVNFHGGGFCLGSATDDSAWCSRLVQDLDAIVVSVGYRLAPEYPFPTAVQDGVDALQYLIANATELGIDVHRIATSGFSAGGNLSITVPLMFHHMQRDVTGLASSDVEIKAIVAWYPSTDFTRSREERAAKMVRPDKQLPRFLTRMFDEGYSPDRATYTDPYLSPFVASNETLALIPKTFILYTCEWDMLEKEGTDLARRLQGDDIGKTVRARMVAGVPHGWDKHPRASPDPDGFYREACVLLGRAFEGEDISSL